MTAQPPTAAAWRDFEPMQLGPIFDHVLEAFH
ncbi:hypothetical protein GON09_005047 [Rhodococcus sp. B50]|nr:hypothetical protein [Rhodococcus sp. B50]